MANISSSTDDELIFAIAHRLKITPIEAGQVVKAFVESVRYCLSENEQVRIKKLGMIFLKKKKITPQKNFEGKTIAQDCWMVRFLAAGSFRDLINNGMRKKKIEKELENTKINLKGN